MSKQVGDLGAARKRKAEAAWPRACIESYRKFGSKAARLYPLIGERVDTPFGKGELKAVRTGASLVVLDRTRKTPLYGTKELVKPMTEVPTDSISPAAPFGSRSAV